MLIFYYIDNIYVQNCIDCTRVEYNVLTEEALLLNLHKSAIQLHKEICIKPYDFCE